MSISTRFVAVVASGAVLAALASSPATASKAPAAVKPKAGHATRHGLVPKVSRFNAVNPAKRQKPLTYHGGVDGIGVTSGTPRVYLVFWGTQWGTQGVNGNGDATFSGDSQGGAPYLQELFKGLGTNGEQWSGTMTQYCDGPGVAKGATSCSAGAAHVGYPAGGSTLAGVWYDHSAEPTAASFKQLGAEAVKAAGHFGNTTAASNRYAQYVVLSAPGRNPDHYKTSPFCAWHSDQSSTAGDVAFTNMPYTMDVGHSCGVGAVNSPGTLDGYSIIEGHEYAETITDQNPNGGWLDKGGNENGDKCAWITSGQGHLADVAMATGSFAMQSTWSNDTNRCDIAHPTVP